MASGTRGTTLPAALVLALCGLAFMAGRVVQRSGLPETTQATTGGVAPLLTGARKLADAAADPADVLPLGDSGAVSPASVQKLAAARQLAASITASLTPAVDESMPINPLDPSQFERFMVEASGLNAMRPPLPAGVSGDNFYHAIPFQILSWFPRIVVYPAFVDVARCEAIIALAKKMMHPSGLAYKPGDIVPASQDTRTSSGTFLASSMDPDGVLAWVEERIAAATLIPRGYGEAFNVLKYEHMQHYDSHYDTFDPKDFGPQPSQRVATMLLYLSPVLEGGETVFKREGSGNGAKDIHDWRNCDDGSFKYTPRQGDAVLFWATKPSGDIDGHALHGGCPVKAGEKWVATKWLRSKGADM